MTEPTTLVSALARLPRGDARGFRFIARDRSERYFPYEALENEARRRAAILDAQGLQKGDRVAIVVPEPHEFVLTFLGCAMAGVVPVPINPQASFRNIDAWVDVLAHVVETSGARVVFHMDANREHVGRLKAEGVQQHDVEVTFAKDATGTEGYTPPSLTPADLCFLQFTSGSTSKPKGVMVTHENLVANATAFLGPHGLDRRDEDVGVSWLPLFHDMGLIGFVLGTLVCDIPVVLLPTETFARSPGLWLETITKYRGSITYAPNFAYELVTKRVKDKDLANLDLSSVRIAGCGAEPIRAKTLQAFAEKFAPAGFRSTSFLPSYGMAESTLAITFHPHGTEMVVDRIDADAMKDGKATPATDATETVLEVVSCGKPFPGHELAVLGETGTPARERQVGHVVTRGPSVTAGYFENEDATADGYRDGWLQTGDLGYFADGNLYICGRIKDLIIIRGANHYPQDIEWSVAEVDGVRRGNVMAFSTLFDGTEELVVAAEGNSGDADRLRQEIIQKVNREFGLAPKDVVIVPVGTLPKTSSGKAQRRKVKTLYDAGSLPAHA